MYFSSRREAGYRLAQHLMKYRYENTVAVALSDGAVELGRQIAAELHCVLALFLAEGIGIPGETTPYGELNQSGHLTVNGAFSQGEAEDYYIEYHGYIEDQKREKMSKMNQLLGSAGIVDEAILRGHNVIVISDGLTDALYLEALVDFIKPLKILRLVIAAPVASVAAVDRAHVLADELQILSVTENYLDTNHYYDSNDIPSHEETIRILQENISNWR